MKSAMVAIRFVLMSLLMAATSAQQQDVPANSPSASFSELSVLIPLVNDANATVDTNATLFNATMRSVSVWSLSLVNTTSFNSSSNGTVDGAVGPSGNLSASKEYASASAELVADIAEELSNATLLEESSIDTITIPTYDFSNLTADELIQLLDATSTVSLELELSSLFGDETSGGNETAESANLPRTLNASARYDNDTIVFPPSPAFNSSSNATKLNVSSADSSEMTITFLTVQNASITLARVQVEDLDGSSSGSSSAASLEGAAQPTSVQQSREQNLLAIETETLLQTSEDVVSHSLGVAIATAIAAVGEAARAASEQFQQSSLATTTTTTASETTASSEAVAVKASAPATESATATTDSSALWVPTVAAAGALVAVVAAVGFGFRSRRQRGYSALSPGSAALAALTPPRALNA